MYKVIEGNPYYLTSIYINIYLIVRELPPLPANCLFYPYNDEIFDAFAFCEFSPCIIIIERSVHLILTTYFIQIALHIHVFLSLSLDIIHEQQFDGQYRA